MMMRIAQSHIRFGHFEHFYYRREPEKVRQLADFVIRHYWPHLLDEPTNMTSGSGMSSPVPLR
jgi:uncharacterized protein YdiU (UPF0061 family)